MGAMNRHPSCKATWRLTTLASKAVSEAHAKLLSANSCLEDVLLAEFAGAKNVSAAEKMMIFLQESADSFAQTQALIRQSIDVALSNPDDFVEARNRLDPIGLSTVWESFLSGDLDDVTLIATKIKDDRLATAKQFIQDLDKLGAQFEPVMHAFKCARDIAAEGRLCEALERNEIPLQRDYGALYSRVLCFMRDYLIDSLVATQVSFDQRQYPALVEAA